MRARLWEVTLVGAAAAAACGAAWALLIAVTGREIGFAAVGAGWAVGAAVRRAAGDERGPRMQRVSAACALLALLAGKYLFLAHLVRELVARQGGAVPGWLDLRLVRFFGALLPRTMSLYDGLWAALALSVAWQALRKP